MNRYPLWKYLIIAVAVIIGTLYSVPNVFDQLPAVQVSSSKAASKVDTALLKKVEDALKAADLKYRSISLKEPNLLVVFDNDATQSRAKDLIQTTVGEPYTVALNLHSMSPEWLASIGALPMYLGLDLRGGVHFLLEVDMKQAVEKAVDSGMIDVRQQLRDKKIQIAGLVKEGQSIVIRFRDSAERDRAAAEITRNTTTLATRNVDGANGEPKLIVSMKPEAMVQVQKDAIEQNVRILRNRVNELGVAEPVIQQQGAERIVVQLPGVQDTARAKEILGRTASLELRPVVDEQGAVEAAMAGNVPYGMDLLYDRSNVPALVKREPIVTGEHITNAQQGFDSQTQEPIVSVGADAVGAKIITAYTRENIKKRMAIVLTEQGKTELLIAPTIQSELGARFQISGRMTSLETQNLAILIRAGALRAPMTIVEERTVGPSLGRANIEKGFKSVLWGFVALSAFICVYYLLMGLISTAALVVNLVLLVALLSMLQATLTLPGIAAIALTLGMAIDANVLINERIREELRNGVSPAMALTAGYDRAWSTILDSNITTLIAGIALFLFGSGPVRGFAVVHCLGILTSMFSAVMVSRGLVNLVYGRSRKLEKISIGQIWRPGV